MLNTKLTSKVRLIAYEITAVTTTKTRRPKENSNNKLIGKGAAVFSGVKVES